MKKRKYYQLNQFERDRIEAMLDGGFKIKDIAKVLKRNKGTISREIKRNELRRDGNKKEGEYDSSLAQKKIKFRRRYSKFQGKKILDNDDLRKYIIKKLKRGWSPDLISGRMKLDKKPFFASKNLIYEWLYSSSGQKYCKYLCTRRYGKKKRRKKQKKTLIPNRIGIEKRPRVSWGFCEGDTIVSGKKTRSKSSLVVTYQNKTKYTGIRKISCLKPNLFNKAILDIKKSQVVNTLTLDNGIENQYHEKIKIPTYFCDPYSSWQKGGVENINRMIRRFVLKGSDISKYSNEYIKEIENFLNNLPRKSLNYKTPKEVMIENNLLIKKPSEVALGG